ncbi:MAG: V-type ATP synthase subunit E family protein [Candidatus Omnitrophica bacterium]|nr:V-type ATP synthase subunit E family protein [Candidatus Omnitrophota bacterium]
MAQEIKDLIDRIQQEGVMAAENQAARIKTEAESLAQKIVAEAKKQAEKIIEQANSEAKKLDDSTNASLKQAGRDLLISLRKEINSMLDRLVKLNIHQSLTIEELTRIIRDLIKNAPLSSDSQIVISLPQQDKEKIEKGFLKQLAEEVKKQVILKSSDEIDSGFIISFDSGKSTFDFSDQALAEYISGSLRPELNKFLKSE